MAVKAIATGSAASSYVDERKQTAGATAPNNSVPSSQMNGVPNNQMGGVPAQGRVDYNDPRFTQVNDDKQQAMQNLADTYSGIIGQTDDYYKAQIDATQQWADKQSALQQEQTDFAIEQIEQQKDQAHSDYLKEQSGAYTDWKRQSAQHGVAAEQMAASGMWGTGYSESSQVAMYTTYQNRVATARESFNQAVMNYNNAMKDARLQNNSALAKIAFDAFQTQLELSLQGFQYKNDLVLDQTNKQLELDNIYHNRWMDVLNQINTEKAFDEQVRQHNQNYELSVKQFNEEIRQFNQQYQESVRQFNQEYSLKQKEYQEGIRQFNAEIARLKANDEKSYKLEIENLEMKKKQLQQEQKQFEAEQALKKAQLAEEKRQFDEQMALKNKSSSGGGGYSGSESSGYSIDKNNESDSSKASVDNQSVLNLGYGPISGDYLAELVSNGTVKAIQNGNKITVQNTDEVYSEKFNKYTKWKF